MRALVHLCLGISSIAAIGTAYRLTTLENPAELLAPETGGLDPERAHEVVQLAHELDARVAQVRQRIRAKRQLARDVIAGQLAYAPAIARLEELCHQDPQNWELARQRFTGTEEERMAKCLCEWVRYELPDQPEKAKQVIARLHAESAAHLQQQ